MDGDTVTPTPEPGQRYLLEVECVPSTAGHPMLTPITADGQPSAIRLAPARYRWHPADVPPQPESPANPRRLYWALRNLVDAVEKNAASLDHDAVRSALEAISAEDERYAQWSPDVPPQPPVLAEGMPVRIADDPSPWEIHTIAVKEELGWWSATVRLKPDLSGIRARRSAPLADVPGPDDTTPTAEPCGAPDEQGRSCSLPAGHNMGNVDLPENHDGLWTNDPAEAAARVIRRLRRDVELNKAGWSAEIERTKHLEDELARLTPPSGEGAALIAATEQEIARITDCPEAMDAWEATARRACAKLDELVRSVGVIRPWLVRHGFPAGDTRHLPQQAVDALEELHGDVEAAQQAPVQATTHGEAGEAQEGVTWKRATEVAQETFDAIEARRAALAERGAGEAQGGAQAAPRVANSSTGANGSLPAVQGAGRDWRGERVAVEVWRGWMAHLGFTEEQIARLEAPLVHTDQCQRLDFGWDCTDENGREFHQGWTEANYVDELIMFVLEHPALGLHDLEQAAAEATRLRRVNDEWGLTMSTLIDGLAERGVPVKLGHRYTQAALDALDSARRELEQLRGEVARVADWFERMADTIGEGPYTDRYLRYAKRVRAALAAAAAPATQDGDPK